VTEYPIGLGQNVALSGTAVTAGMPLTDGPANPHEILDIFFNLNSARGVYASAMEACSVCKRFW